MFIGVSRYDIFIINIPLIIEIFANSFLAGVADLPTSGDGRRRVRAWGFSVRRCDLGPAPPRGLCNKIGDGPTNIG